MNNRLQNPNKPFVLLSFLVLLALMLAACQPASTPTQPAPAAATQAPAATATTAAPMETPAVPQTGAGEEPTVATANSDKFGPILVDGKGMTLYMFKKDGPNQSNCSGKCLEAWPPLLTAGKPVAGDGVDAALLGSTSMADGSKIVTYKGMPLYYWAGDTKPGDTAGQDVNQVWYVVAPDGAVIETAADGAPKASPTASATDDKSSGSSGGSDDDVKLRVASSAQFGPILVDNKGMTLYMFTKDEANKSNCAGKCLDAWPPLLDNGDVKGEDGVDESLIGSADLPDGRKIVTYNGMPLYYWAGDTKPGDTAGQGVNGVWYVVSPEGKSIGQ